MKTNGPKLKIVASCIDCSHEQSTSYQHQSDSGYNVRCAHPSMPVPARIGDTNWSTPKWCPLLADAMEKLLKEHQP